MRSAIVTELHCGRCGELLEMEDDPPALGRRRHTYSLPTGAAMVHRQLFVKPCPNCFQEVRQ